MNTPQVRTAGPTAQGLDEVVKNYKTMVKTMIGSESIQADVMAQLKASFDDFGLDQSQMGEVIAQVMIATSTAYNKDALGVAAELELKEAQIELIKRQALGYDDNMLLKIVEHQASLASFAVNAGSKTAQSTIDALKQKMAAVEGRVQPRPGQGVCPPIARVISIPTNFHIDLTTATTVKLTWDSVIDADQYKIYRDGNLIATESKLMLVDDQLITKTKYAYTVKAVSQSLESGHSDVEIATTS